MSISRKILFLIGLAVCLVACQQAPEGGEGSANPEPTAMSTAALTSTPTPQSTAMTDPLALRFIDIPEQIAPRGEAFATLDTSAYLRYRDFEAAEMTWSVVANEHIAALIADGAITASPLEANWTGSEIIQVEACEPTGVCVTAGIAYTVLDESLFSGVSVTYIGNCGILITVGDKKVLVDALFTGSAGAYLLPSAVREPLLNAAPPFDGVDLILATHDHSDHFTASMVRQHMQNNPEAVFVSTSQAIGQLAEFGERVIAVDPVEGAPVYVEANGIQVEAIYLSHGYPPNDPDEAFNNAYIVTIDGLRFFHTGDIHDLRDAEQYHLAEANIDLAFISHSYMISETSRTTIETAVGAVYLFPMHFQSVQRASVREAIRANYPDAIILFQALETWHMPSPGN